MFKGIVLFIVFIIIVVAIIVVPPIIWPNVFTTLNNISKGSITLLLNLLEFFGLIVALGLILFVLYQLIRYYFPRRFVFEGFGNESELISAKLKQLYLSKLAWEELAYQSQTLSNQFRQYANNSTNNLSLETDVKMLPPDNLMFIPPPGMIDLDLSNLFVGPGTDILDWVKSAEGKIPKEFGLIMSIISFLGAIIPPPVVKIDCYLQRLDGMPGKVGITFEIVDIKKQRTLMRTIWQDEKIDKSELIQWYKELMCPTMRWLVLECCKQRMVLNVPLINHIIKVREKRRQAQILYLLGTQFYASSEEFNLHESFFFQIAADHFQMASNTDLDWILPDLYLANLYSFKMQETERGEMREKLLMEVLRLYDKTLYRAQKMIVYERHRIIIAKALAELTSNDDKLIDKAKQEIKDIIAEKDPADYDSARPDCAAYLYNLARWYELSLELWAGVPNADLEARRYLAYSLARSQSLWDRRYLNQHFSLLHEDGDLEVLIEELGKKLHEKPELAWLMGKNFKTEIGEILEKVDQRLGRTGS